jgi:hypothetical protein
MCYRVIAIIICCLITSLASANSLRIQAAQGLQRFVMALKNHDIKTLQQLMTEDMRVEVLWLDAEPIQKFTLTKADYLQQAKATWRLSSQESYEMSQVVWREPQGTETAIASFISTEKRVILQSQTGQRHELEMAWALVNGSPRVVHIKTKVSMW